MIDNAIGKKTFRPGSTLLCHCCSRNEPSSSLVAGESTMVKRFLVLSTAVLIGVASLGATDAEARGRRGHGGAVAAGVIGGLAVGALIGAAASSAYAAPSYSYGHTYAPFGYDYAPARHGYSYAPAYEYTYAPQPVYRPRVVHRYRYAPEYRATRVVRRGDSYGPVEYGYYEPYYRH
jgi:hypothetical protein